MEIGSAFALQFVRSVGVERPCEVAFIALIHEVFVQALHHNLVGREMVNNLVAL